jgi:hypothetical protein
MINIAVILIVIGAVIAGFNCLKDLRQRTIKSDQKLMAEILRLRYDLVDAKEELRILRRREARGKSERDAEQLKIFDATVKIKDEF